MIPMATVDDYDGNLHQVPLNRVADWYDDLDEKSEENVISDAETPLSA